MKNKENILDEIGLICWLVLISLGAIAFVICIGLLARITQAEQDIRTLDKVQYEHKVYLESILNSQN